MAVRSCRVTVCDENGVSHSADVMAASLYEAVALGLAAMRGDGWAGQGAEQFSTVQVSVTPAPVVHCVRMHDFEKWVNRTSGSPKEMAGRALIRSILGLPR
jgi:hypothetical protein